MVAFDTSMSLQTPRAVPRPSGEQGAEWVAEAILTGPGSRGGSGQGTVEALVSMRPDIFFSDA